MYKISPSTLKWTSSDYILFDCSQLHDMSMQSCKSDPVQSYLVHGTIKSNKAPPKYWSYLRSSMKIGPHKKIEQISNHTVVPTINGAIASELHTYIHTYIHTFI